MRKILSYGFLALLLAAAFLVGCVPEYYPDDHHHPYPYPDTPYGRNGEHGDVHGTVASVNPRERLIYLDEGRGERDRPPIVLSYDDGTVVRYQGQTYRPEDLERGDRIQASIDRSGNNGRLFASNIDVLYDVSEGGPGGYDNNNGGYGDRDVRTDVRGTVRSIDTRSRTLEIDRSDDGPDPGGYSDSR
ncbi:MAG TPA: hypothetical protein VIJ02_02290, partial [Thermoanaerobaculia bacterium]